MLTLSHRDHTACQAVSDVLSRVGDKWTVLVVELLSDRPMRFNELRRKLPSVTQRMLTKQLRELEEVGILSRTVFPVVPPRVDYELTAAGHSLEPVVRALAAWGARNVVCEDGHNRIRLADETKTASPGRDAA